jgi:hydrogenase maturation protease
MSIPSSVDSVTILGLGNVLVGDDALGPWAVRALEARYELGAGVTIIEGTPGNDLVPHLIGADAVIVVDTVRTAGTPGEIRFYERERLLRTPPPPRLNPHQPGLKEALLTLELMGMGPRDVLLIGVIPEAVETGVGMTSTVTRALDDVVDAVAAELKRLGHAPRPRAKALPLEIWWEKEPAHA